MNNKSKNMMILSMSICYLILSYFIFKVFMKDPILINWFIIMLFYPYLDFYYKIALTSVCLISITRKYLIMIYTMLNPSMELLKSVDPISYDYFGELTTKIEYIILSFIAFYIFYPLITYYLLKKIGLYKRINIIVGINNE